MVPRIRPLISIGYKYNMCKVLFFFKDNTGSTQTGLPYLYKYPDQFTNVYIRPFVFPLAMYKFFGYVNEVDSHNRSRQSDLTLDKIWVTRVVGYGYVQQLLWE